MNMVGQNAQAVIEMVESMGLTYEVCYYDDDETVAGITVFGLGGCDQYEFEMDVDGVVEAQGAFNWD